MKFYLKENANQRAVFGFPCLKAFLLLVHIILCLFILYLLFFIILFCLNIRWDHSQTLFWCVSWCSTFFLYRNSSVDIQEEKSNVERESS